MPAEHLQMIVPLGAAETALASPFLTRDGVALYPHPVERAAVCCSRIARTRLFPHSNRKIAFECMRVMLMGEGYGWRESAAATTAMLSRLARREVSEEEFVDWVRRRTALESS